MTLFVVLVILFVLALGGGSFGHSSRGYMSWSPAGLILLVAVVLYLTGHLSFHG